MKTFFTAKGAKGAKENQKRKSVKGLLSGVLFGRAVNFFCGFIASLFLFYFFFAPFAPFAVNISFVSRGE
jgi:thiamine transporter ThiT